MRAVADAADLASLLHDTTSADELVSEVVENTVLFLSTIV